MNRLKLLLPGLIFFIAVGCAHTTIEKKTRESPAKFAISNPIGGAFATVCVMGVVAGAIAQSPWILFGLMGCGIFTGTYVELAKEIPAEPLLPEDVPNETQIPPS